ncbi:short-chain dehydrogenase [Stachybotrys elegans]|uniref:Short-chain dehydrogenase n=1 Tax=Stachybotrys elegans TaxID=80388 RepID=A0A8K0SIV6_9HYPO|nr:short-chain dehydrogenase [Stachybotrys elegans]
MYAQFRQMFPPRPCFTSADVESQEGKVFLVTGGYSGIGLELAKILYHKTARVYIAGHSWEKATKAVEEIRSTVPNGGSVEFLHLDLDDLSSIGSAVEEFKSKESKLHVLWDNAGISQPPVGSLSKQGIELQLATNCLGPFLPTKLLLPLLQAASADAVPNSVRIVWSSSQIMELSAPHHGINMAELGNPPDTARAYVNSKTGNTFLASEFAKRLDPSHKILNLSQNPGPCRTRLFRHTPALPYLAWPLLHHPKYGALTCLFSGLSKEITWDDNGGYIIPWGRIGNLRKDLKEATEEQTSGGSGRASEFWEYSDDATSMYV